MAATGKAPKWEASVRVTVVLAVGVDSEMLEAESTLWRSKGYFFIAAQTIQEAIAHVHAGDFDIALLDDSISLEKRERLAFLIRASGSQTHVVCMGDRPSECESFADATFGNDFRELFDGIRELLKHKHEVRASREDVFNSYLSGEFLQTA
jgi:DNA-binding response OmpR family regulator